MRLHLPKWLLPWLLLALAAPVSASGAEFTANMVLQQKGRVMPGKIFIKDNKMRQEFLDHEGHTITIVRRDKRLVWVVMPWDRTYVEFPLGIQLPGQFLQIPPESLSRRRVGDEEINGYQVERFEVTLPGAPAKPTGWPPSWGCPSKPWPLTASTPWNIKISGKKSSKTGSSKCPPAVRRSRLPHLHPDKVFCFRFSVFCFRKKKCRAGTARRSQAPASRPSRAWRASGFPSRRLGTRIYM
jgi:hypothetical protein